MTRMFALAAFLLSALPSTSAYAATREHCVKDPNGTRTCYNASGTARTTHIMRVPVKAYERGLKRGTCMPSPVPGACGGG